MNWFWRLKIAQKFMVFMSFALFFLALTGFMGLYATQQSENKLVSLYQDALVPVTVIDNAMFDSYLNRANVLMMISEQDPEKRAEIEKNIAAVVMIFNNQMKKIENAKVNAADKVQDKRTG